MHIFTFQQVLALLPGPLLLLSPERDRALLHELQQPARQAQGLEEGEAIDDAERFPGTGHSKTKSQCQLFEEYFRTNPRSQISSVLIGRHCW